MKIDFVSDVACPWCAIGLHSLERALEHLGPDFPVELHFQPFELNPGMAPEGQDLVDYLSKKYGLTAQQVEQNQEAIRQRGEAVGFTFRMDRRTRSYNTFDAHRLLHWAGLQGRQRELKHALFSAYFTEGDNPGARDVLLRCAGAVGLDESQAGEVLDGGRYTDEVRERERFYQDAGIHAVPAVIIDDRHLISGGQPPEVFERALRQLAAGS
ncbi:DsbA family oxidoreductase [Schlegelella sp. S2-27]|uniref:DsbA family oxidoreductase n=1 Tax=Caldimonas mangrovi TaxID=2944811 RepID=A0ABT0YUZ1_9BURK|nr:DsbA family oxidoreductase [Caldimonas mangrovi]MCM5682570.1 DsbA family oxidoreductase [Caldimonas mangrovi]